MKEEIVQRSRDENLQLETKWAKSEQETRYLGKGESFRLTLNSH